MDLKKTDLGGKKQQWQPCTYVCNWYPLATALPLCSHGTVLDFMIKKH